MKAFTYSYVSYIYMSNLCNQLLVYSPIAWSCFTVVGRLRIRRRRYIVCDCNGFSDTTVFFTVVDVSQMLQSVWLQLIIY